MITMRKITADELDCLENLHEHLDFSSYKNRLCNAILSGVKDVYIINFNETIVGEITVQYGEKSPLETIPGKRVYFSAFRIIPEFRNRKLGQQLLRFVIDDLKSKGYSEFTIGVEDGNENAIHLYSKFGFSKSISRRKEFYEGVPCEYTLLLCDGE